MDPREETCECGRQATEECETPVGRFPVCDKDGCAMRVMASARCEMETAVEGALRGQGFDDPDLPSVSRAVVESLPLLSPSRVARALYALRLSAIRVGRCERDLVAARRAGGPILEMALGNLDRWLTRTSRAETRLIKYARIFAGVER